MFDDSQEARDDASDDPGKRLSEKLAELRMLAELAAIFEGPRKFKARLRTDLTIEHARELQRAVALLDKSKKPGMPVLPPEKWPDAVALLKRPEQLELSVGDYHLHRRPGEVMLVRWLDNTLADGFYKRMQAHLDVALEQAREDERQALGWKQDPGIASYLDGLDKARFEMEDHYARKAVRMGACVLSTVATDDMNIVFLADHLMGVTPADLVGAASAPEDPFDESKLGWYFKLLSLRGPVNSRERLLFFAYLQRSDDSFDSE
jgi:hypothetical protein